MSFDAETTSRLARNQPPSNKRSVSYRKEDQFLVALSCAQPVN